MAYFDSPDPIEVSFRFSDPTPTDVTVQVEGGGEVVRTIALEQLSPGQEHIVAWDGLTDSRKAAPDGKYLLRLGPSGGQLGR
ncbi:MAG: hypothetical protein M3O25_06960, partial [Actinomycetota bacterium]|nr:hypothetical protein [Actinomycetota bacterium]